MLNRQRGRSWGALTLPLLLGVCFGCTGGTNDSPAKATGSALPPKPSFSVSKLFDRDLLPIAEQCASQAGLETGINDGLRQVVSDSGMKGVDPPAKRTVRLSLEKATPESADKLMHSFRAELTQAAQSVKLKVEEGIDKVHEGHIEGFHLAYRLDHATLGKVAATLERGKALGLDPSGKTVIKAAGPASYLLTIVQTESLVE